MLKHSATEEDYKKRNFYEISSLQRGSTSQETGQSTGDQDLNTNQNSPLDLMKLSVDPALAAVSQYESNSQAPNPTMPSTTESNE